jgi:uncharacterized membrane protein YidH (DUF202 family)
MLKTIGIVLIAIGILALVVPAIPFTKKETVLDVGPIKATAEKQEHLSVPSIVGISVLVVGAALLAVGATRKV